MSSYKEEIDNMVWSYSRVSCYNHCPYNFLLKHIVNDDTIYLAESNFYAESGSYIHSILEKIFNGEIKVEDALQYYLEHYDENVFYKTSESSMSKTYEACADYFASIDFDWLNDFEILGVEKKVNISICGYKFVGYIDLLLKNKDTQDIYIVDHKSSSYPFKKDGKSILKKSESDFEKYKKQMYLYCAAVYEEYGKYPKWIVWNHFKEQKIAKIEFDIDDYNLSIQWFLDVIHKIENDENFEANVDYFYCTKLCDFRNSCEYINQDN